MFSEVELLRDVMVHAENFKSNRLVSQHQSLIVSRLLEDLLSEKVSKDHGYFLAVTGLKKIGKGKVVEELGDVLFPVVFNCRTFLPYAGEILQGLVYHVTRLGVLLRCGPIKIAFLSATKMPGYQYVCGRSLPGHKCGHDRKPLFVSNELAKIENGVVVCFKVLAVRWFENWANMKNEFGMLATLEGDSLGPVSLSGSCELDL